MKLQTALDRYHAAQERAKKIIEGYERGEPLYPHWEEAKCRYHFCEFCPKEALRELLTIARAASEHEIDALTTVKRNPYYESGGGFCSQIQHEERRADK